MVIDVFSASVLSFSPGVNQLPDELRGEVLCELMVKLEYLDWDTLNDVIPLNDGSIYARCQSEGPTIQLFLADEVGTY